jgi:hypothetical protein
MLSSSLISCLFCVSLADEANNLMDWEEDTGSSKRELKKLLDFLTAISKARRLAHVVLVSSNYFLATWLSQRRLYLHLLFRFLSIFSYNQGILLLICSWNDPGQV